MSLVDSVLIFSCSCYYYAGIINIDRFYRTPQVITPVIRELYLFPYHQRRFTEHAH